MKKTLKIFIILFCSTGLFSQDINDTLGNASLRKEDSTKIKINRLSINSNKSDFSPVLINKQLIFVSGRENNLGIEYVDVKGGTEITDLFTCTRIDSIKYKNTKPFDPTINSKYYEGPFCFNKKGTIIYFTANDKKSNSLKIYSSEKINNSWAKPVILPFCLPEYSYCHPCLSPNEDRLVFSSNINAEKNKMDLYMSVYDNGNWSLPIALPKKINDANNQVFPFISQKNTLYFSSDKKTGLGGLDIYSISLNSDTATLRCLSYPINSIADDFGVWIDSTSETGYFSSNRNARYKDDIYYFSKDIPDFSNWKKIITKTTFCYTFFEETTMANKDTLNLTYEWNFGDGQKGRGLKKRHCFAKPGEYLIQLNIVDKVSGEIFTNETSSSLVVEKPDQLSIECTDSIVADQNLIINSKSCYLKGYQLNKIYWSFGDGKYNSGSMVKHIYNTPGTYTIEMGLLAKDQNSEKVEHYKVEKNIVVINKK